MRGASRYSQLFETGQYGRFYCVSGKHARGRTFQIFILPIGEEGIWNGRNNVPLNGNAVEVYGVIGGNPGWNESYGWLREGAWCVDFENLAVERECEKERDRILKKEENERKQIEIKLREDRLLGDYESDEGISGAGVST